MGQNAVGKGKVVAIKINNDRRDKYTLNRIEFADGKHAFEKSELYQPVSEFVQDTICTYEITHPGNSGKPDWIKFTGTVDPFGTVKVAPSSIREYTIVMQNAWGHAVNLVGDGFWKELPIPMPTGLNDEKLETLKGLAHQIADSIIQSAKDLQIKHG